MSSHAPTGRRRIGALLSVLTIVVSTAGATGGPSVADPARQPTPEDRYAMAGGCYAIRSLDAGAYVGRDTDGFVLSDGDGGEPFHFQATDLGSYLLFSSDSRFLAAAEGLSGT